MTRPQLAELWRAHEALVAHVQGDIAVQHSEIDKWDHDIRAGVAQAVSDYFATVVDDEIFLDSFPHGAEISFVEETKELVIEYDLPPFSEISEISAYRYVKQRDEIVGTRMPPSQRMTLYTSVVTQVTLGMLYVLANADSYGVLKTIVFSGYTDAIDKASGRPIRACIISVRADREVLLRLDLAHVEPIACLKRLRMVNPGTTSGQKKNIDRYAAVNLMDLSPLEFEELIAALFQKMGLETELTKASHDGGIDCIAYDRHPVLGGVIVIQAKRYRHTVSVSVVRDLFGAVQDRRAMKGILVTTSGYGSDSHKFASDKPLQLIDGSMLVQLLAEHMGMEARVDMPDET